MCTCFHLAFESFDISTIFSAELVFQCGRAVGFGSRRDSNMRGLEENAFFLSRDSIRRCDNWILTEGRERSTELKWPSSPFGSQDM